MSTHLVRRMQSCLALFAVLMAIVLAVTASPASSQVRRVTDPRNVPASTDIRSVTYGNHEFSTVTVVKVRSLPATGSLVVRVAPMDADVIYNARVSRTPAGVLQKRFTYVTNTSTSVRPCTFVASWSMRADQVRVAVPHSCLRFGRFLTNHWMQATFSSGGHRDAATGRDVGRGDSPGCVTRAEYRRVARGQPMSTVHAQIDTAGRFGDGGAGGFSRLYKACRGGTYWIEYDGWRHTVLGKGRVTAR